MFFFGIFGVYDDAIHINSISVHKQMNGCVLGAHIIHKEYNESSCTLNTESLVELIQNAHSVSNSNSNNGQEVCEGNKSMDGFPQNTFT